MNLGTVVVTRRLVNILTDSLNGFLNGLPRPEADVLIHFVESFNYICVCCTCSILTTSIKETWFVLRTWICW